MAEVALDDVRGALSVEDGAGLGAALDVYDAVIRTGACAVVDDGRLAGRQHAELPGRRPVDAALFVAARSAYALCELVDVKACPAVGVLVELQLVDTQRDVVQEGSGLLVPYLRRIERLRVGADLRVAPDGRCEHERHGLASLRLDAPQVDEEAKRPELFDQRRREGRREHDLCRDALRPASDGLLAPCIEAAHVVDGAV